MRVLAACLLLVAVVGAPTATGERTGRPTYGPSKEGRASEDSSAGTPPGTIFIPLAKVPFNPTQRDPMPLGHACVWGRILLGRPEGHSQVLHLDKGSAVGVKVGLEGEILLGPRGEAPVFNGYLRIVQVLDEQRSLAVTPLKSLGRNNRFVLYCRR